ncbi:DUF4362 domain-containing protein [Desulfosporosinus shakirovi]|uniref:DUF4362 domain-containing protein n=1 Tax=Desulfosporosinus shakirovi TaxID=2885154 RepID=UPI001E3CDC7F|nr:DUF4362 domain-containing protein [Desulfosporosinus sp. SRJS8]MCB8818884.1 DUF4362 domain-containing protein [Desulfosporosinus sp. SRJS8]
MQRFSFVLAALVLALTITGCSDRKVSPQIQPQESKTFQGNIVVDQSGTISDVNVVDNFLASVSQGEVANLQIKKFTEEGDPIFQTLYYDKNLIKLTIDDSQDKMRAANKGPGTKTGEYVRLVKKEDGKNIVYNLIDKTGNPSRILVSSNK